MVIVVNGLFLCFLPCPQVGLILTVEAGIFPLMCGWWIDICSFVSQCHTLSIYNHAFILVYPSHQLSLFVQALFGSTMKNRHDSLERAPGNVKITCLLFVSLSPSTLIFSFSVSLSIFISLSLSLFPPPPPRYCDVSSLAGRHDLHLLPCIICHAPERGIEAWCALVPT